MKERQEQLSGAVELAGGHMLREAALVREEGEGGGETLRVGGRRRDAVHSSGGRVARALHPAPPVLTQLPPNRVT